MRLIDADALKIDYGFTWDDITPTHEEMYALIDRQPTADARENVTGIWQLIRWGDDRWECTACGRMVHGEYGEMIGKKFCDFCGAHMVGVKTSEAQRDEAKDAID